MDVDDEEDALFGEDNLHLQDVDFEDSGVVITIDEEVGEFEEDDFDEDEELDLENEDTMYF